MDLVSRLKQYINYRNIPVTAFADECSIPRPTLSQLLNGRNKRVSDELLRKIHDAYPDLSVMWLMFGEGEMLAESANNGFESVSRGADAQPKVEASAAAMADFDSLKSPAAASTETLSFDFSTPESGEEIPPEYNIGGAKIKIPDHAEAEASSDNLPPSGEKQLGAPHTPKTITFSNEGSKSIVNIIVYYSDNSYEAFGPLK